MAEDVYMGGMGAEGDGDENAAVLYDGISSGGRLGNARDSDNDDAGDVSDADSDYLELQADIARLDANRQAFLSEHLGPDYKTQDERGRDSSSRAAAGSSRRRRGPRKAAEPSAEVKFRLQQAHQLFMDHRYEDALAALHDIIRVNAETHAAWSLLASINEDLGRRDDAMMAKVFAAHLEPKRVAGWLSAADYALAEAEEVEDGEDGQPLDDEERRNRRLQNLQVARLCYSGAIRADKDNIAARLGKANVCLEFGQATNAATEYVRVLKRRPLALQVIRNLAEASYDSVRGAETIQAAVRAYRKAIAYLRSRSRQVSHNYYEPFLVLDEGEEFGWMDVTIYVELFAAVARYDEAVAALKSLARWLLGRGGPDEAYWKDAGEDDDREWDRYDEPRRRAVPEFQPGRYPPTAYGEGLPLDLRAKLAIYRLRLGHEEEAIEHLSCIDPQDAGTTESMRLYPHLLKEIGQALFDAKRFELALQYLELYRDLNRAEAAAAADFDPNNFFEQQDALNNAAADSDDAEALVLQGKCNLELHDHAAAEESFLAAIEADDENIEARVELAKMYETAQESREQAFILVNEALSLEAAQQKNQRQQARSGEQPAISDAGEGGAEKRQDGRHRGPMARSLETAGFRVFLDSEGKVVRRRRKKQADGQDESRPETRKPRPRATKAGEGEREGGATRSATTGSRQPVGSSNGNRARALRGHARRFFASPAEQAEFEATTSARLRTRYQLCQDVKARADAGDADAAAQWMDAARELIDDFRSFREFYSWDKYVQFLGYNNFLHDRTVGGGGEGAAGKTEPVAAAAGQPSSDLTALAERLHQNLAPADADGPLASQQQQPSLSTLPSTAPVRRDYRGIPFDDWLALFLEYALRLAHVGRATDAYAVCQAAHDSTVYRQHDSMFLIHLAWAACAVRASDEKTSVAVARYFMRERPFTTDCYRLFATMCRLCRAPSVWFCSSPVQKYILRQIRQRDETLTKTADDEASQAAQLDVCLLVVYGHILFASTSFSFALNYYQRALAVDPSNPVISLCIGLSYVHWALKRQAENRHYLLTQGLNFLYRYAAGRLTEADKAANGAHARRETYFNVGRTYHLLGLHALAAEFYGKVLQEGGEEISNNALAARDHDMEKRSYYPDLRTEAAYNLRTYYLLSGNHEAAMNIALAYLVM